MFQNRDDNVKYENQKLLTFCFKRVVWWSLLEVLITRYLLFYDFDFQLAEEIKAWYTFPITRFSKTSFETLGRNYVIFKRLSEKIQPPPQFRVKNNFAGNSGSGKTLPRLE